MGMGWVWGEGHRREGWRAGVRAVRRRGRRTRVRGPVRLPLSAGSLRRAGIRRRGWELPPREPGVEASRMRGVSDGGRSGVPALWSPVVCNDANSVSAVPSWRSGRTFVLLLLCFCFGCVGVYPAAAASACPPRVPMGTRGHGRRGTAGLQGVTALSTPRPLRAAPTGPDPDVIQKITTTQQLLLARGRNNTIMPVARGFCGRRWVPASNEGRRPLLYAKSHGDHSGR